MQSVRDASIGGKTVLLRVDYNVPMENGKILDANRIKRSLTTINYLLEHKAKIVLCTHFGKPKGKMDPASSTLPLAEELARQLKREVKATDFVIHDNVKSIISKMEPLDILMLGNLRWDEGEEKNDQEFAKKLASYADIYVNDAFGASHRAHASIEAVTRFLPSYAGFLIESEVTTLSLLLRNPVRPFVLVMGGAKVGDKTAMIENLATKVDKILIGGGIANTFLAARGEEISDSLYESEMIEKCKELIRVNADKIVLPSDTLKKNEEGGKFAILDIGTATRENYRSIISGAKTIFWNGNMGKSEEDEFAGGTKAIALAITQNPASTVVAGGDTVGFVLSHHLEEGISFISTGGGATLEFLAGLTLPGIEALDIAGNKQDE